jgi:acetyl-CoA carboxylase biotin carboxyl carrier protein
MPEQHRPSERTAEERQADHAGLARLSETLVTALVQKLNGSGLGELEVREGDWKIRLRRPAGAAAAARRERPRTGGHVAPRPAPLNPAPPTPAPAAPRDPHRAIATSPAVGTFRAITPVGSRVRQGDRIAVVDLLGIAQDVAAPIDGLLVEVLAGTGDAVEYGEEIAVIAEPVIADGAGPGSPADEGNPT